MRRSVEEKLHILSQATSRKKIKKLALQYGITTKTIRNWQNALKEGRLGTVKAGVVTKTKSAAFGGVSKKLLSNFAFRYEKIPCPVTSNGKDIYRYLFTDIDRGYIFSGFSTVRDKTTTIHTLKKFIELVTQGGKCVRNIVTCNDPDQDEFKQTVSGYGAVLTVRTLNEIRKHLKFSLKKENYIYERAKYENKKDFLTDSLATVCKNNDNIFEIGRCRDKSVLALVKKINAILHMSFLDEDSDCSVEEFLKDVTDRAFNKAFEFHKVYDLDNAEPRYEKIYYVLKHTHIESDMYVKVIIQRAKISALRKNEKEAFRLINLALRVIKTERPTHALEFQNSLYFLAADICRERKDRKRTMHYVRKSLPVIEKMNNPDKSAISYINIAHIYKNFADYKKTSFYLNRSREIIYGSSLKHLYPQIEESLASMYSSTGRYDEAKKVFGKMIDENRYSDSPFFRSLLYGKTADIYHLTGEFDKSIGLYDSAIEISVKHKNLRAFMELMLVLRANRAFTLTKMNRYDEAKSLLLENLQTAREGNFPEQVLTNTAHLVHCSTGLNDIAGAKEYNSQLGELLKNNRRPDHEYKRIIAKGDIERMSGRVEKALKLYEEATEEAVKAGIETAYYESVLKLAGLRIELKYYPAAEEMLRSARKKAVKKKYENYVFKSDLLLKKIHFLSSGAKNNYAEYLKRKISEENLKDECRYFMLNEQKSIKSSGK